MRIFRDLAECLFAVVVLAVWIIKEEIETKKRGTK